MVANCPKVPCAVITAHGNVESAVPRVGAAPAPASSPPRAEGAGALTDQLEQLERDAIIKALEHARYNKTAAAKLLGVTYRALRYKIQKLEIE
jgi:two-component system response regulator PilR (NtrC family)